MQGSGWRMALVISVPVLGVPGNSSVMVVVSGVSRVAGWASSGSIVGLNFLILGSESRGSGDRLQEGPHIALQRGNSYGG